MPECVIYKYLSISFFVASTPSYVPLVSHYAFSKRIGGVLTKVAALAGNACKA